MGPRWTAALDTVSNGVTLKGLPDRRATARRRCRLGWDNDAGRLPDQNRRGPDVPGLHPDSPHSSPDTSSSPPDRDQARQPGVLRTAPDGDRPGRRDRRRTTVATTSTSRSRTWTLSSPRRSRSGPTRRRRWSRTGKGVADLFRDHLRRMRGRSPRRLLRLGVLVGALRTEEATSSPPTAWKLSYGELSADASGPPEARAARPKRSEDFKIIGRPQVKYKLDEIVQGRHPYAMDLFVQGVPADGCGHGGDRRNDRGVDRRSRSQGDSGRRPPSPISPACPTTSSPRPWRSPPSVRHCQEGRKTPQDHVEALVPHHHLSDAQIDGMLNEIIDQVDLDRARASTRPSGWPYNVPHAPMEEMLAVAEVRSDSAEVWVKLREIAARRRLAETLGLHLEQVTQRSTSTGGAFGDLFQRIIHHGRPAFPTDRQAREAAVAVGRGHQTRPLPPGLHPPRQGHGRGRRRRASFDTAWPARKMDARRGLGCLSPAT